MINAINNGIEKYICIIFYQDGMYCPPPSLAALIAGEMRKVVSIQAKRLLRTELSAND